jgi:hypothetical protein
MTLRLTQPLTEMSARNISWSKGGRCLGLTNFPHSCVDCLEIGECQLPGDVRVCPGIALPILYDSTITFCKNVKIERHYHNL